MSLLRLCQGVQTSQDARFYAISSRFEPFSNEGKSLVIQFTVKHEQKIDCGGGYVKIFPADLDQANMHGDSQYYIMFGECVCALDVPCTSVCFESEGVFEEAGTLKHSLVCVYAGSFPFVSDEMSRAQ